MSTPSQEPNGIIIKYKKLSPDAIVPTKGTPGSAGSDMYSAVDIEIPGVELIKNEDGKDEIHIHEVLVKTDIACKIPDTHYGKLASRSSVAWKHNVHVAAGVIDSDYLGNLGVVLYNLSYKPFKIKKGDRIAQIIFERIDNKPEFVEVNELDKTERNEGGYGSTGV